MLSMVLGFFNIGTPEMLIIMLAILLLFGGKKLPELARGLGRGIREFKDASESIKRDIREQMSSIEKEVDPKNLFVDDVEEEIKSALPPSKQPTALQQTTEEVTGIQPASTSEEAQAPADSDEEDEEPKAQTFPKLGPPPGTYQHNPHGTSYEENHGRTSSIEDENNR